MACVVGNKSKDIGMGIRKSIVVSFLPCLDAFCGSIPICHFIFKMVFCDLFRLFFLREKVW